MNQICDSLFKRKKKKNIVILIKDEQHFKLSK